MTVLLSGCYGNWRAGPDLKRFGARDGSSKQRMRKLLQSLVDIWIGHTFRGPIIEDSISNVRVLQIRGMTADGVIDTASLPRIRWDSASVPPTLESKDIVIAARGDHHGVAIADGVAPVVPTSQFYVLRARSSLITPEFLCWYLRQADAQNYFLANRTGSNIPMLNKRAIQTVPVAVPSPRAQVQIIALHRMSQEEKRLTERLRSNRETMLNGAFRRLLES